MIGRGLGFVMARGIGMIRTHLFRQEGHGYIFGGRDYWLGPKNPLANAIETFFPGIHQISAVHDFVVDYLQGRGWPKWAANFPTMLPSAAVAILRTSANLAVDLGSLGQLPVPFPHSDY